MLITMIVKNSPKNQLPKGVNKQGSWRDCHGQRTQTTLSYQCWTCWFEWVIPPSWAMLNGKKGIFRSIHTTQANGMPVKIVFVRNRNKKRLTYYLEHRLYS